MTIWQCAYCAIPPHLLPGTHAHIFSLSLDAGYPNCLPFSFCFQGEGTVAALLRRVPTAEFRRETLGMFVADMSVAFGRVASLAADINLFQETHACDVTM